MGLALGWGEWGTLSKHLKNVDSDKKIIISFNNTVDIMRYTKRINHKQEMMQNLGEGAIIMAWNQEVSSQSSEVLGTYPPDLSCIPRYAAHWSSLK